MEAHHGVNDALRMHHHFNLRDREAEKPMGLDHLQAFVHHARAIDGDLAAHAPRRVIQSLLESHTANLLGAPSSERSAACREDD